MKMKDVVGTEPERKVVKNYDPKMIDRVLMMKPAQVETYWRNLRRKAGTIQK